MFSNDAPSQLGGRIAELRAAVDGLAVAELTSASSLELTSALRELEVEAIRLASATRRTLAEIDQRGVAREFGVASTSHLVRDLLRLTPIEAGARVRAARDFGPRRALNGDALDPVVPRVADALDAGRISLPHAKVIVKLLTDLPAQVEREHGAAVEEFMVEQATQLNPLLLADVAIRLRDTLNPDGTLHDEADRVRRRDFRLTVHADGSSTPSGLLTPELTAALRPVLDSLSAPRPSEDGMADDRTPGQRRHDGLLDAALRLLRSGSLPESGGCPVTILVTVTEAQLAAREGLAADGYGSPVSMGTLLRLSAEAEIIPVVLNVNGGILNYGRTRRLATTGQRRALAARDRGCSFPGCTCPAAWAEVHHIVEWINGGGTDLDNLVLLCGFHHRHFASAGWIVRMSDESVPEWLPPPWLDPDQVPRRNTAHGSLLPI